MKVKTFGIIAVVFLIFIAIFASGPSVQAQSSTVGIVKVVAAQDAVIDKIADTLKAGGSAAQVAADVDKLASAAIKLQAVETGAYKLSATREGAPQEMTRIQMAKAIQEAKAMGMSSSLRLNMLTEWETARTLGDAEQSVAKAEASIAAMKETTSKTGTVFRALPSWLGGTTTYANYKVPAMPSSSDAQLARLAAIEAKLNGVSK